MVNHIKRLLLNRTDGGVYQVDDKPTDVVLSFFGLTGTELDDSIVDKLMPIAMAPDLAYFRRFFDKRTSMPDNGSVYRHRYEACTASKCADMSNDDLYTRVLGKDGLFDTATLFSTTDANANIVLAEMQSVIRSADAVFSLGVVLLACAYRRLILQPNYYKG